MKLIRYQSQDGSIQYGTIQPDGKIMQTKGSLFSGITGTQQPANVQKLLAPLVPSNILCLGLNYRRHAEESGMPIPSYPVLFMKTRNTIQNPEDLILIPTHMKSEQVDYEGELAVVIGKSAKNVSRQHALEYVLGYTCANDVSARDWQLANSGGQWCRGKIFDTFCPIGPCLVTADEIPNPNDLAIKTVLNESVVQNWRTDDMIFDIPRVIEFLSGSTTLEPGTIILTGTPHGVGMAAKPPRYLKAGDTISVEIEKIGKLTNKVALEE